MLTKPLLNISCTFSSIEDPSQEIHHRQMDPRARMLISPWMQIFFWQQGRTSVRTADVYMKLMYQIQKLLRSGRSRTEFYERSPLSTNAVNSLSSTSEMIV
ncbi:hypothetical protein AVEN_209941-1 [Araneus ventricosus]|uniref:Uncharacterized protein n=1 Tax=Araneus ventricosus TaxID=182803 RepID=A0A4Y2DDD7_ARAVE|nr:hypothetical protein AVEN_209941-1 [Araneus ventricosus]